MKNGIIIKGVAYKACKVRIWTINPFLNDACGLCDYKRRCKGNAPCTLFEDKDHEVYFKKVKNTKSTTH